MLVRLVYPLFQAIETHRQLSIARDEFFLDMNLEIKRDIIIYSRTKPNRHCFSRYTDMGGVSRILRKTMGNQLINDYRRERQIKLVGLYMCFVTKISDIISQFYINSRTTKGG